MESQQPDESDEAYIARLEAETTRINEETARLKAQNDIAETQLKDLVWRYKLLKNPGKIIEGDYTIVTDPAPERTTPPRITLGLDTAENDK